MSKSFFKIFLSKSKENKWLNTLGQSGLLLEKISDSKYSFSVNKNKKYFYSVEYLDCSPESDRAKDILDEYKTRGIVPLVTSGNWVYFMSESEIIQSKKVAKRNSIPYFWRSLYLLFFAICGAVVCGYQFFAVNFLDKIDHASDGIINHFTIDSSGTSFDKILELVVKPINVIIDFFNNYYISIFTDIFGKNDAIPVIAMIMPVVLVLVLLGALNLTEYITYFKRFSKIRKVRK